MLALLFESLQLSVGFGARHHLNNPQRRNDSAANNGPIGKHPQRFLELPLRLETNFKVDGLVLRDRLSKGFVHVDEGRHQHHPAFHQLFQVLEQGKQLAIGSTSHNARNYKLSVRAFVRQLLHKLQKLPTKTVEIYGGFGVEIEVGAAVKVLHHTLCPNVKLKFFGAAHLAATANSNAAALLAHHPHDHQFGLVDYSADLVGIP